MNVFVLIDNNSVLFDESHPSTWTTPLSQLQKSILLSKLPVQKMLDNFPKRGQLSFNPSHYMKKATGTSGREWLVYSVSTNSLFCFSCSVFTGTTSTLANSPWTNIGINNVGFTDFPHQARAIKLHEESQAHFQSVICWKQYEKLHSSSKLINQSVQEATLNEISFWKQVLHSMLDAIIFLAKNNLAFRGTSSKLDDHDCGNFLSLIKLLGKYYPPLALHISRLKKSKVSYMSPSIQNEFIYLSAATVRKEILQNVKERDYYSIMFDATQDASRNEQISQVLRTVKINAGECKIEENFIDFINYDGKSGLQLTEMIIRKLVEDGLDIQNCRGQVYDNGSNMSGFYQGVQARFKEINKKAIFIPCPDHSLNRVGESSANKVLPAKLLLGQIQCLFVFFSGSTSRWSVLKSHINKCLKGHSSTRWASKAEAVSTLFEEFEGTCEALIELTNSEEVNAQTVADANSQFVRIFNFKFILGLTIWDFILSRIQITNLALQDKSITLEIASKHVKGLLNWLKDFKLQGFEKSVRITEKKAEDIGITKDSGFHYRLTRGIRPLRFRDVGSRETHGATHQNNLEKFESDFFIALIDTMVDQFGHRFDSIYETTEAFNFLWGISLNQNNTESNIKAVQDLAKKYENDFELSVFCKEILYLKSAITPFIEDRSVEKMSAMDILNILTINGLQQQFINCHTALRIFLTIPVTTATNERSFSKMKIMKNYLRSTMGQQRLSDLSILSIEHDIVERLSFDEIINNFSISKCRKVKI